MRFIFLCFLVFSSCTEERKILPYSTGKNSEVIFVVDDLLWENTIESLVKITFGTAIDGVNQTESLFKVIQINHGELRSILKTHTNIVIILEGTTSFKKSNEWATNQLVAQLNWENNPQKLTKELTEIRKVFVKKELISIKSIFEKSSQQCFS